MAKTIFMELLILAITAFLVILSEILSKKRKRIKKCLIKSLKTQAYYMMAYILFGILIPLVCHTSNLTIHNITIAVILSLEVTSFLQSFFKHLQKAPKKNSVPIMIIKIIMEKIKLFLEHFCKKRIGTIPESAN